jgi:hypothetical protein
VSTTNLYQHNIDESITAVLTATDLAEIQYSQHGELLLCNFQRPEDRQAVVDLIAETTWWYTADAATTRTWYTEGMGDVLMIMIDYIAYNAADNIPF